MRKVSFVLDDDIAFLTSNGWESRGELVEDLRVLYPYPRPSNTLSYDPDPLVSFAKEVEAGSIKFDRVEYPSLLPFDHNKEY